MEKGTNWILIAFFAWVGSTSHMLGDFFRDAAVLLVIFVPLELWKPGSPFQGNWLQLGLGTIVLLGIGMVFEYVSIAAFRIKCDLQEDSHGSK